MDVSADEAKDAVLQMMPQQEFGVFPLKQIFFFCSNFLYHFYYTTLPKSLRYYTTIPDQ